MDLVTPEEIRQIMQHRSELSVSLFMPTHRAGSQVQKDPTRFRNLLKEAREHLTARGVREGDAAELLKPAQSLGQDTMFWQHQSDGLAIFVSPETFSYFRAPLRFTPLVTVSERFHVKPLLPLLTGDGRFLVLALSQKSVRLFQGTRFNVNPVDDMGDIPTSIEDALGTPQPDDQLQFRTGTTDARGGHSAIFHGQTYGDEDLKKDLLRYFSIIDRGVTRMLGDDKAPLVLAGVDYLLPIYAEANSYPHLIGEGIFGNPDRMRPEELHKAAWEIVRPYFRRAEERAADRYREVLGTGLASSNVREVLPAAAHGRVDSLFVALGVHVWGTYDEAEMSVDILDHSTSDNEDLLDLAAVHTLNNGGHVYAVPRERVPGSEDIAAIFRY